MRRAALGAARVGTRGARAKHQLVTVELVSDTM